MYTKGEWKVGTFKPLSNPVVYVRGGTELWERKRIADCFEEANAHLIAAAPLQNETLKDVASMAKDDDLWETHTIRELRQIIACKCYIALAKAKGGK